MNRMVASTAKMYLHASAGVCVRLSSVQREGGVDQEGEKRDGTTHADENGLSTGSDMARTLESLGYGWSETGCGSGK